MPELEFDFEAEMPKSSRTGGGSGREGRHWEEELDPLRQRPGIKARVFTFTNKTETGRIVTARSQAASRISSITNRLRKKAPYELWKFNVRPYADGDDSTVGIWITFERVMSEDEYQEYNQRREQRAEAIRAGRERNAGKSSSDTVIPDDEETPFLETDDKDTEDQEQTLTPAERVRRAREAAANA